MNVRFRRGWVRTGVGAAALLAAGAFAGPAYADTTADLEIKFVGTTIAPGSDAKFGSFSLVNHGPSAAAGIVLTFDISALDTTKVELDVPPECTGTTTVVCPAPPEFTVKSGEDFDGLWLLIKQPGASGDAGQLTASVSHAGTDPVAANNTVTVDVKIADSGGPDLATAALDVYKDTDDAPGEPGPDQPIPPGGTSNLWVFVINQGDAAANGVKMSITMPEHVSFTEPEPDCTHSVGSSTTTCEYDTVVLTPEGDDSLGIFFFPLKVAASAPGPVVLPGGLVTVEAMQQTAAAAAGALPRNFTRVTPQDLKDVDPSDNTDEFSVFVAAPAGGPAPLPLPETGGKVGLIGGAGAAALVLGLVLVLAARRRRPVAVGSADQNLID
jgi:hypothetical protein